MIPIGSRVPGSQMLNAEAQQLPPFPAIHRHIAGGTWPGMSTNTRCRETLGIDRINNRTNNSNSLWIVIIFKRLWMKSHTSISFELKTVSDVIHLMRFSMINQPLWSNFWVLPGISPSNSKAKASWTTRALRQQSGATWIPIAPSEQKCQTSWVECKLAHVGNTWLLWEYTALEPGDMNQPIYVDIVGYTATIRSEYRKWPLKC